MSRPVDLQPPSGGGDSVRLRMIRSLLPNLADWDSQICGSHRASQAQDSVAKLLLQLLLSPYLPLHGIPIRISRPRTPFTDN